MKLVFYDNGTINQSFSFDLYGPKKKIGSEVYIKYGPYNSVKRFGQVMKNDAEFMNFLRGILEITGMMVIGSSFSCTMKNIRVAESYGYGIIAIGSKNGILIELPSQIEYKFIRPEDFTGDFEEMVRAEYPN